MQLKICHLYPEALNLYGDRGNILCMKQRLLWRGIDCQIGQIHIGEHLSPAEYDIFFMGGGQDFEQEVLLKDLAGPNGQEIRAAIEDGKTFLGICGGYQILGTHYETKDGVQCEFLGALNLYTVGGTKRLIGNYAYRIADTTGSAEHTGGADHAGRREPADTGFSSAKGATAKNGADSVVVGFENHSGRTYLGEGVKPLGSVLAGFGNNGKDGTEGARYKNVFGTYSHGPVLPKNPFFCDMLLQNALERKYGAASLEPLDDTFERTAHDTVLHQVMYQRGHVAGNAHR